MAIIRILTLNTNIMKLRKYNNFDMLHDKREFIQVSLIKSEMPFKTGC